MATEARVPFISIAGSDFVEMFAGTAVASHTETHSPLLYQASAVPESVTCSDRHGNLPLVWCTLMNWMQWAGLGRKGESVLNAIRDEGVLMCRAVEGHHEQESTLNQLLVEMDG